MRSRTKLIAASLVCASVLTPAAQHSRPAFTGTFDQLSAQQQALLRRWASGQEEILGRPLDPRQTYDALQLSVRTTYQAVTHALQNSTLTTADGRSLGTALDLVDTVERVSGQVPGTRGDRQYRVYVFLKPDAVNKLYAAREFERGRDNTVFHIGYPINFRQQGGAPSIQFSVARTGRRADIDVDYRSSSGLAALFSGHLTSANSDVGAEPNASIHDRRWGGLSNWWKELMALFVEVPAPEESVEGLAPGSESERRRIARGPVEDAVHAYLTDWLVKRTPEELLPLVSITAYPCVAEFDDGSHPDSRLALMRILRRMQMRTQLLGKVARLEDVVTPVGYPLPGATHRTHAYSNLFSLQQVHDDVAWAIDCRVRYRLQLVESIPRPPHQLGDTYVVSMRVKDPKEPESFLVQTWRKEAGEWRLASFDIKRKSLTPPADLVSAADPLPRLNADEGQLAADAKALFSAWLVRKRPEEAARYFLPESKACAHDQDVTALLEGLAHKAIPNAHLEGIMSSVTVGHADLEPLAHRHGSAFVLARVSGDLVPMSTCDFESWEARRSAPSPDVPMATIFTLVRAAAGEHDPVVTLYWRKTPEGWRVASFTVATD